MPRIRTTSAEECPDVDDEVEDDGEIVIRKMKLNSFCADGTRPQLVCRIRKMVLDMNRVMGEAYEFASLHILRTLDQGVDLLPQIDRNFFYRCIVAVTDNDAKNTTLPDTMVETKTIFDSLRTTTTAAKIDIREYNQIVADATITMATMATNHLWTNLDGRIAKHVKQAYPHLAKLRSSISAAAVDPKLKNTGLKAGTPKHDEALHLVQTLRETLRMPTKSRFKTRAHLTLPLYHRILRQIEESDDASQRKSRRFSLLPAKRNFTVSYMPLSTEMMIVLLKKAKLDVGFKGRGTEAEKAACWKKYFNLNAVEQRGCTFDGRIVTDGCGVSVQLRREQPSDSLSSPPDGNLTDCRVVWKGRNEYNAVVSGVDPGLSDIVTVASTNGETRSFSSSRFYERAGTKTSNRCTDRWNMETQDLVSTLISRNTADVEKLKASIASYLAVLPELLAHRAKKGYRSMRFYRYTRRQAAIEEVCDFIAPEDQINIVGFGDWNGQAKGIKRKYTGPIRDVKRRLESRDNVLFLNIAEHRTSKVCHTCNSELCNMKAKTTRWQRDGSKREIASRVHKVLHCRNSVKTASSEVRCGATWNRDVNASRNMLELAMCKILGYQRPDAFCTKQQRMLRGGVVNQGVGTSPSCDHVVILSTPEQGKYGTNSSIP